MGGTFFILLAVVFVLLFTGGVMADYIYLSSPDLIYNIGDSVLVNVYVNSTENNIYGVQFDLNYNSAILSFDFISEGEFLSSDGAVTFFSYGLVGGGLVDNIYNVRNKTFLEVNQGITGEGIVVILNFSAISAGTLNLNLSNIIWVNSTIVNDSVPIIIPTINGLVLTVNTSNLSLFCGDLICNNGETCSSCAADCGACIVDNGGGGGGGSGGSNSGVITLNITKNQTNITEVPSMPNINTDEFGRVTEEQNFLNENRSNNDKGGFLALTGNVIGNAAKNVFTSWVFYFILGLAIVFVVVVILRRRYRIKHPISQY